MRRTLALLLALAGCSPSRAVSPPAAGQIALTTQADQVLLPVGTYPEDGLNVPHVLAALGDTLKWGLTLPSYGQRASCAYLSVKPYPGYPTTEWNLPVRQAVTSLSSTFLTLRAVAGSSWDSMAFTAWAWGGKNGCTSFNANASFDSTLLTPTGFKVLRRALPPPSGQIDSSQVQALVQTPDAVNLLSTAGTLPPGGRFVGVSYQFCVYVWAGGTWRVADESAAVCSFVPPTPAKSTWTPLRPGVILVAYRR